MNTKIIIDIIGTCINTIVLGFAIYKYVELNTRDNLEKELENLRTFFRFLEEKPCIYKKQKIKYPLDFIYKERLIILGISKKQIFFEIKKDYSIYDNFYEYIRTLTSYCTCKELTMLQMNTLYDIFTENLVQRDKLHQTFQILYSCIHNITSKRVVLYSSKDEKITRVQNCITSKQAIFYFFNQVKFADRQIENSEYIKELRKCDFFKKMFESQEYNDIKRLISHSVEKNFSKKNKKEA